MNPTILQNPETVIKYKTLISTVTFWLVLKEIWRKKAKMITLFKLLLVNIKTKLTKFSKIVPNATSIKL